MQKDIILNKVEVFKKALSGCPELIYVGDNRLRIKSCEADFKDCYEIVKVLKSVLLRYRNIAGVGRGLAAPQIGVNKNIFITFVNDEFQVYINPKIIERSETFNYYRELCMSSGLLWGDVKRPDYILMEWYDELGNKSSQRFDGFMARLLQHEYDHLLGVVNLDVCEPGSIEFVMSNPLEEKLRSERVL